MNVLFVINSRFSGDTLSHRALGGTETALIGVSTALARLPDVNVVICADVESSSTYDGIKYIPAPQLGQWTRNNPVDVLISVREWIPLWLPIRARHRIYFSPDAYDQPAMHSAIDATLRIGGVVTSRSILQPPAFYDGVDQFFCVGRWQAETFAQELNIPREKIFVTGNAIFPERFKPLPLRERDNSIVYSATPFRGLEFMPDYYRAMKEALPDLKFELLGGMGVYGDGNTHEEDTFEPLYRELQNIGANLHGPVVQQTLAAVMCRSRVYTYPNTFAETFCISVLEAQAAGLPVVTSRLGAMPERIEHGANGFLIQGDPADARYKEEFLKITLRLLQDSALWQDVSDAAIATAGEHTYSKLATAWQENFSAALLASHQFSLPDIPEIPPVEIPDPARPGKKLELPPHYVQQFLGQESLKFGFES